MGSDNKCRAVLNFSVDGKTRIACSICGTIWDDKVKGSCPGCHRRIKPSQAATKFTIGK